MLIDRYLPDYEFSERHSTEIAASREIVFAALEGVTAAEVPSFRFLMGIRSLPSRLRGNGYVDLHGRGTLIDQMTGAGFKILFRYPPTEGVIGSIGRFWQLRPPSFVDFGDADGFVRFGEPGYAKAVMNFHVWPLEDGRCTLSTETRVQTTDDSTRHSFARYWRLIRGPSGLIRRDWLRAIKARAEELAESA
jgi:hypothetical protein